jgi:NAD(P)-dependent dehydrogenase (short-subunit alcohol dehydrogenase family)
VTGCSSGIGRAIAARLAEAGWPVYASARRRESIEDLAAIGCELLVLDVTDDASRRAAIERIENEHGSVGALVNNAGFGQQGPLEETPLEAIRAQFETNVFGAIALCQLALPGMRRAHAGRIVNISSMGGRLTFPGGGAYHGSKFALEAMSDVLRFEVEGFGIDVVVIEPGPTTSSFGEASIRSFESLESAADDAYASFRAGIQSALEATFRSPPPGAATPQEVAEAVWAGLTADRPLPRVIVGAMARELIELNQSGSARDWDRVVAGMYPQPGVGPEED